MNTVGRPQGSLNESTLKLIAAAQAELEEFSPQTVRQIYYRLLYLGLVKNDQGGYVKVMNMLITARQNDMIPWDAIEDRTRFPTTYSMWPDLESYLRDVKRSYKRDVWKSQPKLVEVWCEKSGLAAMLWPVVRRYGVTLFVVRGYSSWSGIYEAHRRFTTWTSLTNTLDSLDGEGDVTGDRATILYYGDLDPDGLFIPFWLEKAFSFFEFRPKIIRCLLNPQDIRTYDLEYAAMRPKKSSKRYDFWLAKFGEEMPAFELDSVPARLLHEIVERDISEHLDMETLREEQTKEAYDKKQLRRLLDGITV